MLRLLISVANVVVLLSSALVMAESLVDPFFAIKYNPAEIHFEPMPAIIKNHCPELRRDYAKAWVYAHTKTADTEYFIIYGYMNAQDHSGKVSAYPEEDDGLIVALRGSKCLVDQWQFFLRKEINPAKNATPIRASDDVLNQLAADLLRRYERAFGGKEDFLRKVNPRSRQELPPVVRAQFEAYSKEGTSP